MHGSGRQHSTSITPGGGHACDAEPTAWANRNGRQGRTGGTASTPSQPAWEGGHDHATARYSAHDSEAHRRVTARTNLSKKTQHNAGRRGRKPAIAGNFFSRPYPTKVRAYLATHFSAFSLLPSVMATLRLSAEPIPPAPVKRMMAPTKPPSALLRSAGTEAVPECGDDGTPMSTASTALRSAGSSPVSDVYSTSCGSESRVRPPRRASRVSAADEDDDVSGRRCGCDSKVDDRPGASDSARGSFGDRAAGSARAVVEPLRAVVPPGNALHPFLRVLLAVADSMDAAAEQAPTVREHGRWRLVGDALVQAVSFVKVRVCATFDAIRAVDGPLCVVMVLGCGGRPG
jgi:hypothetical protein